MNKPIPMSTPNESAYSDFKKWINKNTSSVKKQMLAHGSDSGKMFMTLSALWYKWAYENAKDFTHITDKSKFGRALMVLMVNDNLIFDKAKWKATNKINHVKEALQKDGHVYNVEEVGELYAMSRGGVPMAKAYVGKDGILGNNNTYISWSEIKRFMGKYAR
jgi:hypothetical protein